VCDRERNARNIWPACCWFSESRSFKRQWFPGRAYADALPFVGHRFERDGRSFGRVCRKEVPLGLMNEARCGAPAGTVPRR